MSRALLIMAVAVIAIAMGHEVKQLFNAAMRPVTAAFDCTSGEHKCYQPGR